MTEEQAVLCPIVEHTFPAPLHIKIKTDDTDAIQSIFDY